MLKGAKSKLPWRNVSIEEARLLYGDNLEADTISPVTGLFEGFTVTVQNIQLAIWLGVKRIYLVGVDHFYLEDQHDNAGAKVVHSGENHFHRDYRKPGELVNNAPVDKMNRCYQLMHEIAVGAGIEIINLSRNTKLDVYKKMDLDKYIMSLNND